MMMQWCLILGLFLLAACQGPNSAPKVPLPAWLPKEMQAQASYPWPQTQWWRALHDEALDTLLATALQDNPSLQATAARIEQAQGLAAMAGAMNQPWLGAEATLNAQRFSGNFVQNKLAGETFGALSISPLTLRYHLDFWGRDRALLTAALGSEHAADAEYAQARLLLSTALARTYIRLSYALARARQTASLVELQTLLQKVLSVRHHRGLDPKQASLNSAQTFALTQQRLLSDQTEIQILRHQLAALIGKDPGWAASYSPQRLDLAKRLPLPARLPLSLLGHRADINAARWRAEVAAQEVKVAHTQFYPDVNLTGFAGFQTVNLTDLLFLGRNAAFAIGPSLSIPLFIGGQLEGNLQQKEGAYHAAVAAYNNTLVRALQDTADALTRWRDSQTRLVQQSEVTTASEQQQHLVTNLHRAGLAHRGQVLEARFRTLEQQVQANIVSLEQDLAAITLIEALGGGYTDTTVP